MAQSQSILFATPCYGGLVTAQHHRSCILTQEELTKQGIANDWLITWNESLVHRGRMEMAATFLRGTWSHLMWIDADIEFDPAHVAALWNLDADVGVGLYAMKRLDMPLSAWRGGKLVRAEDCPQEPFPVDYAGTGFMMIKRETLEALAEKVPTFQGAKGPVPALFMTPIHNGILESEDYNFCRIAREAGFTVMADPSIKLKHWGTYAYGA